MDKIIYGDCIEIMRKLSDLSIDMLLTDIPYGIGNKKSHGLRILDKGKADIVTFDLGIFVDECIRLTKGSIYIFCWVTQISYIAQKFIDKGLIIRQGIWEKTNPSPMNGQHIWLSSLENCMFARKKKATFNQHCKSSVWRFPTKRSKLHPTEKPQKLLEYLIQSSSNEQDTILDPCAGSGSTGVACRNLGRKFILIEKEQEYCELMSQRLQQTYVDGRDLHVI